MVKITEVNKWTVYSGELKHAKRPTLALNIAYFSSLLVFKEHT